MLYKKHIFGNWGDLMLLALDLDNTILNFHSHNDLCHNIFKFKSGEATHKDILELLKIKSQDGLKPFKHQKDMLALIKSALNDDHDVAIVSYTDFPQIISTLLEQLGLNSEEVSKIYVRGGLPSRDNQEKYGKQLHIEDALEHFGYQKSDHAKAVLLDDSWQNYALAEEQGFKAVLAPAEYEPDSKEYFKETRNILKQSKQASYVPSFQSEYNATVKTENITVAEKNLKFSH